MLPPPPPPPPPKKADGGGWNGDDSSSPTTTSFSPKMIRPNKFPSKLLEMLTTGEEEGGRTVGWTPEGDGILIRDVPTFTSDVLPRYFRHSNIGSFQRQLLLYGFVRDAAASDVQAYRHEMFPRDDPETCLRITRPPSGTTTSSAKSTGKPMAGASKPKPKSSSVAAARSHTSTGGVGIVIPPTAFKTADASRFVLPSADGAYQAAGEPTAFALNMAQDSFDVEMSQRKRRRKKVKARSFPGAKPFLTLGEGGSANENDTVDLSTNDSEGYTRSPASMIGDDHWNGGGQFVGGSPAGHYSPTYGGSYSDQPAMPLPLRLCRDDDMYHLSERQCYARRHLVEYFLATKEIVRRRNRLGGNHGIELNQVGIRCSFCCDVNPKLQPKAATGFPRSIKALNAAVTEMLRQHTEKCQYVPAAVKEVLGTLKANRPKTKPGNINNESPQEYWIRSCAELGMVDTDGHNGFGGIQLKHGVPDATSVSTFMDRKRYNNNEEKKEEPTDDMGEFYSDFGSLTQPYSYPHFLSMSLTPPSAATSSASSTFASGRMSPASDITDPALYWSSRYSEFKNYSLKPDGGGGKKTKGKVTGTAKAAKGKSGVYNSSQKKPANGRLIPPEAIQILKDWLFANAHHPYTSDEQRDALCRQTGLNKLQVKNWLTNSRRRLLRPMLEKMGKGGGGKV